jgi:heme oxygenase (biliverdin-IX-beta and delta-forming)
MSGSEPIHAVSPRQATLACLRQATASRHARIESLTGLGGSFGLGHYGRFVQGFHAFLRPWEPLMARSLPAHLQAWFAGGRRVGLLERDLVALDLPALPADQAPMPSLGTCAHALGSLYVLEGSALGGQVIAAQVQRTLGLDAAGGAAYFHGCGQGTGARWREFRQHLADELDGRPAAQPQAVQGALDTFDSLIALLRGVLHERGAA